MTEVSAILSAETTRDGLTRLGVALGDPVRQTVLMRLADSPAYPLELAELCATSRSNMSNHLACLRGCGLVVAERQGRQIQYQLVSKEFADALRTIASATLSSTCDHT